MEHEIFEPSTPWPEPEPDREQPGRVWRTWVLVVDPNVDAEPNDFSTDRDVRVFAESQRRITVRIRSDNPDTCDLHEVMTKTREVFREVDARWHLVTVQGVPKDRWLFLR